MVAVNLTSEDDINVDVVSAKAQPPYVPEAWHVLTVECLTAVITVIAFIGVAANVINVIVFHRQGLKTTVNIGLTGLAVSDLCSLLTLPWYIPMAKTFPKGAGLNIFYHDAQQLTVGFPHACFTRTTAWLTVLLTAERCLCVALPLKFKRTMTPRRVRLAVCFVYFIMFVSLLPEYTTAYLDWNWDSRANVSVLGIFFAPNRQQTEGISFLLYGIYALVAFPAVVLSTSVMVARLKQSSVKRKMMNSSIVGVGAVSRRDQKAINLVIAVACVFIITYIPMVLICLQAFIEPSATPANNGLVHVVVSAGLVFDAINSSVNIITYYTMSSKYRNHFNALLCLKTNTLKGFANVDASVNVRF